MRGVMDRIPQKQVGIIMMGSGEAEKISDVINIFGEEIKVHVRGIVDGYTYEYIRENLWPKDNEPFIVSKIKNNQNIMVSEEKAKKLVNLKIQELADAGIHHVLIFCTGHFDKATAKGCIIIPENVICGILTGLGLSSVGVIVPEEGQIPDSLKQYGAFNPIIRAASPYKDMADLRKTAEKFREEAVELILTDCMGFTEAMGESVRKASGKNVLVPRVLIPAMMKHLI
ncbi:MAG: hypothetical protein HPY66_2433 [Firmicutes bacterium]|nr:hypothetical protein [Bacillota bacterium]